MVLHFVLQNITVTVTRQCETITESVCMYSKVPGVYCKPLISHSLSTLYYMDKAEVFAGNEEAVSDLWEN